jgi:copper homeostasis protein
MPGASMPLVEACCDSVHTARAAQEFGASRVELCGLGDGGSTPSLGMVARCRDAITIPLFVMIRPQVRDFVYVEDDVEVMCNDIIAMRSLGADGVVVGPLRSDDTVHTQQLAEFVRLARPMKVTFHRAFDRTPDAMAAIDELLLTGTDYVLTSGQAPTASDGADTLRTLQQRVGDRLTVMAGGSVRGPTVRKLVQAAGLRAVHARGTDPTIIRDVVAALSAHSS